MTQPRSRTIDLDHTPYYHCISRCVRRAFLCGKDHYSGRSFEHRRQWIVDLIKKLASMFCIDVCAYAMMHNHYHLVLHVDRDKCLALSDREVIRRWLMFHKGGVEIERFCAGASLGDQELARIGRIVELWRERLYSVSWFMKLLNQTISKRANQEDDCKGKFWECRFKCQALLDENALLSCMAYVDLNPIRAGIATTIEESDFTSIQQRLKKYQACQQGSRDNAMRQSEKLVFEDAWEGLMPFSVIRREQQDDKDHTTVACQARASLPFCEQDYLAWLQYVGGVSQLANLGPLSCDTAFGQAVPRDIQKFFVQLDMDVWQFLETLDRLESLYPARMGRYSTLEKYARKIGLAWCRGVGHSRTLCRKKRVH